MTAAVIESTGLSTSRFAKLQPWLVCFSAGLFFFFEFMQVNMFNALDPALIRGLHMSTTQLGHLSANYFYANVLSLIPAGILLDRCSTRRVILMAMSLSVLCTFLFSLSHTIWQAELCRAVTGFGGAFCFLSCVRLASRWFPPRKMALVVGLLVTFAMTGAMVAQTPFTVLTDDFGWREVLRGDAAVGLLLLFVVFAFIKDYPAGSEAAVKEQHSALAEIGFWASMQGALSNLQNWMAGIYASLINLPVFILGATWGGLYLVQIDHMTRAQSSLVTSMLFLGLIIGSPLSGWFSDRIRQRKLPMILGSVVSLIIVLIVMFTSHLSFIALMGLFFIWGIAGSTQIVAYPLVAESNPAYLTGSSESVASVLIMSGGFMIGVFPRLLNLHWSHTVVNSIPVYSFGDYRLALSVLPIAFFISLLAAFALKETHCQSLESVSDPKS